MRTQWVFMERCGCPFGVLEGACAIDEEAAWVDFYEDRREIRAAKDRGVRVEHVSHDGYVKHFYPKMLGSYSCPHQAQAVA